MNFFFNTPKDGISSNITIPKFRNSGALPDAVSLFSADIFDGRWIINLVNCEEDQYFWNIPCIDRNKDSIYFIATQEEAAIIENKNILCIINSHTSTSPDYRANLCIKNSTGGFSSYQSEYPFRMTTKLGSLYSDCGLLTTSECKSVGVFIKNIFHKPENRNIPMYLYNNSSGSVIAKFEVAINKTTFIDLTKHKEQLDSCFIFAENFLGIPIYLVEHIDGGLSFEHTHPPHESIGGIERYKLVEKLKVEASEKISQNTI